MKHLDMSAEELAKCFVRVGHIPRANNQQVVCIARGVGEAIQVGDVLIVLGHGPRGAARIYIRAPKGLEISRVKERFIKSRF